MHRNDASTVASVVTYALDNPIRQVCPPKDRFLVLLQASIVMQVQGTFTHDSQIRIPGRGIRFIVSAHRLLWGVYFRRAWQEMPLDTKFVWLFFVNNTIAVITLLELFVLRHR